MNGAKLKRAQQIGKVMDSAIPDVRRLCKEVAEEEDAARMKLLLDKLLQILEER
jgi:hypothetical protein